MADAYETDTYRRLALWAARPKQTPARIMAAERQLRKATPRMTPADAAKMQYVALSRILDGDTSTLNSDNEHESARTRMLTMLWLRLPWERSTRPPALELADGLEL